MEEKRLPCLIAHDAIGFESVSFLEVNNRLIGGLIELVGRIVRNVKHGLQDIYVMPCTIVFDCIHDYLLFLDDYMDLLRLSKSL